MFLECEINENNSLCEVTGCVLNKNNESSKICRNSERFTLTTENEVNQLVSNAQAQSTKTKTNYAVNIFKGTLIAIFIHKQSREINV